jgi:hypothetical protein
MGYSLSCGSRCGDWRGGHQWGTQVHQAASQGKKISVHAVKAVVSQESRLVTWITLHLRLGTSVGDSVGCA